MHLGITLPAIAMTLFGFSAQATIDDVEGRMQVPPGLESYVPVDYVWKFEPGWRHPKCKKVPSTCIENQDESEAVGKMKSYVLKALSLGNGNGDGDDGYVIVGLTNGMHNKESVVCIKDVKDRPDFLVHEPHGGNSGNLYVEYFKVYVTTSKDPNEATWVYLGMGGSTDKNKGFSGFDIADIGLDEIYWIKIVDAGSKKSNHKQGFEGVDISTTLIAKPCEPKMASISTLTTRGPYQGPPKITYQL